MTEDHHFKWLFKPNSCVLVLQDGSQDSSLVPFKSGIPCIPFVLHTSGGVLLMFLVLDT